MKSAFLQIGLLASTTLVGQNQLPPTPEPSPMSVSFCSLASDLPSSVGLTVTVRARVIPTLGVLTMFDSDCDKFIVLTYPNNPSTLAALRRSKPFHQFQYYLEAKVKPKDAKYQCITCNRYEVRATVTGLVQYVNRGKPPQKNKGPQRPAARTKNIGLVVRSVSEVTAKDLYGTFYDRRKYLP
jgi:hypothetical protein